jgi:hypothetical protein
VIAREVFLFTQITPTPLLRAPAQCMPLQPAAVKDKAPASEVLKGSQRE